MRMITTASPKYTYTVQIGYTSSRNYTREATFGSRAAAVRYYESLNPGSKYRIRLLTPTGRIAAREGKGLVNPIRLGSVNVRSPRAERVAV